MPPRRRDPAPRPTVAVLSRDPAFPALDARFRVVTRAPCPDQVAVVLQAGADRLILDSIGLPPTEALVLFAAALDVTVPLVLRVDPDQVVVRRLATGVGRAGAIIARALPAPVLGDVLHVVPDVQIGPLYVGMPCVAPPHLGVNHLRLLALCAQDTGRTGDHLAAHRDRTRRTLYDQMRDLRLLLGLPQLYRLGDLWPQVCARLAQP